MVDLSKFELISINGGQEPPHVSSDAAVQFGYNIGYRFGRAIAHSISFVKYIFEEEILKGC